MKILSISDVITNSSSEVFCYIAHDDPQVLDEIYDLLSKIIKDDCYYDEDYVTITNNSELEGEDYRDNLEICMPYRLWSCSEFYKAGLEAILEKYFEDYTIYYQ